MPAGSIPCGLFRAAPIGINTPGNLMHWIQHPQTVVPGNGMPELGVTEDQARDIAAYLYAQ